MRPLGATLALLAALSAAGCAQAPVFAPPLTDIADRACVAAPALDGAVVTAPTVDGDREKPAVAMLDGKSPCVAVPEGKATYAVFALPDGGPFTIRVASVPQGASLFAPRAFVLDGQGAVLRELAVSSFMFRGDCPTALYRSHPGERYLLVRSDVGSVGKLLSRIQESVHQTVASTGYATFIIYSGNDLPSDTVWSHNGEITVSVVSDKPPKK